MALFFNLCQNCQIWSNHLIDLSTVTLSKASKIGFNKNFTHAHLVHLNGILYTESLQNLQNLEELKICYSILKKLENEALCHSSKLQSLELNFLPIKPSPNFEIGLLKNCVNIREFSFLFCRNCFVTLPSHFFVQLPNLEALTLTSINLTYFEKNFFGVNSTKLRKLILVNANIERILPNALEDFKNLEKLAIVENPKLETLPLRLFINLPKLQDLNLKGNSLQNLSWSEFEGLKQLKRLNLAENKITALDAKKIAILFPNLWFLSIEKNHLGCEKMERFLGDLWNITKPFMVIYKNNIKCHDVSGKLSSF